MTDNNTTQEYDLIVIGGGSGGVRAARWSASLGAKVAIIEEDRYGGTCVLRGCIPKKMMVYAAHFADDARTAADFGLDIQEKGHDWNAFRKTREKELTRLSGLYENMLTKNGVDIFEGRGVLTDQHTVKVGTQSLSAKNILIAVGGKPNRLDMAGAEHALDSNAFFKLEQRPDKVIINGGGFIGVEFACLLNHLGTEVHIILRGEHILRGFDKECAQFLQQSMIDAGIKFHLKSHIKKIECKGPKKIATLESGAMEADEIIFATGRSPMTAGLGLENAGVEIDPQRGHAIKVNAYSQTNIPNIYAVGDVTNRMNLTPVALREGMLVAEALFNHTKIPMTYDHIPAAVFASPPLSTVGQTEEECLEQGIDIDVYTSNFRPLKYTLGTRQVRSFMKMIVEKKSTKVLGLHMVGDDAPEIMQGCAVALKAGATKEVFDQTIGIHPSSAEEFVTMRTPREQPPKP